MTISSIQFRCSVMSNSLWPHEWQHTRPPCPSPTPGAYSNPYPSGRWCHPAILSSVVPFSFCPQSLPTSGKNWKTIALTRQTIVGKIMSLLFNMLSRLVITFLPRSKHLLISWLQSPSAVILEPPPKKFWHCFHCFSIYFLWSDGTRCHDLSFLNVEL